MLPSNVDTGLVEGRFIVGVADGADPGDMPDAIAARGAVTFTSSVPYFPNPTASPSPVTILKTSIVCPLDEDGYVCTPSPDDPTLPGARGVRLFATDDPDLSVEGWTWGASYRFEPVNGYALAIPAHSFALPSGTTADLTSAVRVPSTPGYGLPQAEAALNETIVSAAVVGDSLVLYRRNGEQIDAGSVRGWPGDQGPRGIGIPEGGAALQFVRLDELGTTTEWATLDKDAVGLSEVDNTSDNDKPVSNATSEALELKQDKLIEDPDDPGFYLIGE